MYVRTHRAGSDPRVAARASGKHPRSLDRWFNQEKFATGERAADADRRPLRSFSLSLSYRSRTASRAFHVRGQRPKTEAVETATRMTT